MTTYDLELTRTVPAPPERVWRALTEPAQLTDWFWPAVWSTTATVDLRVGGRYRIAAPGGPGGGFAVSGEFTEVSAPRRLAYGWLWEGDADATRVSVDLRPDGAGTALTLRHEGFPDAATREMNVQGWTDCLDRLPEMLERERTAQG